MIQQILAELSRGSTTVSELARKLNTEQGALEQMLWFMARKGLVRPLRPECRARACSGCPGAEACEASRVSVFELVAGAGSAGRSEDVRRRHS